MPVEEELKSALERLVRGEITKPDRQAVENALKNGRLSMATGERAIAVGGNVTDTVFVTGDGAVVLSLKESDAGAIRRLLEDIIDSAPVNVGSITGAIGIAVGNRARSNVHIEHYHENWSPPLPREVPSLPLHFIDRPEIIQPVLGPLSLPTQTVVALSGIEGVGKTVLSSKVAGELSERFRDGTLWGECHGGSGELNDLLGGFLARLGADRDRFRSYDERLTTLRTLITSRQVLIVLDNLQDTRFNPRSLLSASGSSCVLFTTSNRNIVAEMADETVEVPPLEDEDAYRLLRKVSSNVIDELSDELKARLIEQSGRLPGLLNNIGRQIRVLKRQGRAALDAWASNVAFDWHDQESLYEFAYFRLNPAARQVFECIGLIANVPFDSVIVAAGLQLDGTSARQSLEQLERFSLIDYDSNGQFIARSPAYRLAKKKLIDSGNIESRLQNIVAYLINTLEEPTPPTAPDTLLLSHAQEIIDQCLQIQNWPLVWRFSEIKTRPVVIRGQMNVWYRSNSPLTRFLKVNFHHSTLANSALVASEFIECNFHDSTVYKLTLAGAVFIECNFSGVSFVRVDLRGTKFIECNFNGSHFIKTDLRGAQFTECNFQDYIFVDLDTKDTIFKDCYGIETIADSV